MTTQTIENEYDLQALFDVLKTMDKPITVSIIKGRKRSTAQNHLQRLWMNQISAQLGDQTPEEVRGYCKLMIGVPILKAENEAFCSSYDAHVEGLPYEQKLAFMMEPLDFPITRIMTTKQKSEYLDQIIRHFSPQGIVLTMPGPPDNWGQDRGYRISGDSV